MSMQSLEREILAELQQVTGNYKLRQKDIVTWSTGALQHEPGEELVRLPALQVNVIYLPPAPAKGPPPGAAKKKPR